MLLQEGYQQINRTNNFYKLNNDFYMVVYLQRKSDGSLYFFNVGIHPMFLFDSTNDVIEEVDCALRTRIGMLSVVESERKENLSKLLNDLHQFSTHYSNYKSIFISHNPNDLTSEDKILNEFSITQVNLCKLYVEYYDFLNNKDTALLFVNYGLSIAPKLAVIPKKFFKEYIRLYTQFENE
ncbi:DUF4304 domain-containing protein [Pelistega sp. NLN82]|uniref:DUF4304 domain-containing protein n=1 Tax=Pelistega ratti TaxID=2652177 RepID=A0A6L9Y6I3_9BURK|nr:DUF4304 domain-containing protein [Pelistega ratti]NEN76072.1 DUF4304 domain-containing protein [Pelistega ratti]